ncbi:helix-turn-helix domain-containing protein [Actinacidiphila sp. bgisy145]|uniref:helix-turn-helix domain-containing protein n=1 Tax=Actinacidiphila sp. bgisy145 TaxID=3413792 RepID=UPI003EBF5A95
MTNPGRFTARKLDPALSARSLYGAELRYYRERAGLTLGELADMLHIELSYLARIEQGERRFDPELADVLDRLLDTGGFFVRNLTAGRSAPDPNKLSPLADWERLAATIKEWDATLVPGLLQTDAYAKAVAETYAPLLADRPTRYRWEARLSRTPVLHDPKGPRYLAVLGEAVLHRGLGGPATMAEQLHSLAALIRRRRITVRVLPLAATPHPTGTDGALRLMTYADESPALHFTAHHTGNHFTDPGAVNLAHLTHDLLTAAALPPEDSLALIESTAADYRARTPAPSAAGERSARARPRGRELEHR